MTELISDPGRIGLPETGIYVRARVGDRVTNVDIMHLDAASLFRWLRSHGGNNEWAENTVAILLGHPRNVLLEMARHTQGEVS